MRLRTLLALMTGAAAGAGATYLFDPDLGLERRRVARRRALRRGRHTAIRALGRARRQAGAAVAAAMAGYEQGRAPHPGTVHG